MKWTNGGAFNEAECWSYYLAKATRTKEKKIYFFGVIELYCMQIVEMTYIFQLNYQRKYIN